MGLFRLLALWRMFRRGRSDGRDGRRYAAPRGYGRGRVRVVGCAPGCLVTSLLLSLFATILLNLILHVV